MERTPGKPQTGIAAAVYSGYCPHCKEAHSFPGTCDSKTANALMTQLARQGQLADGFPISPLFGDMRGKMFGVMTCLAQDGNIVEIKAFSGQFNGSWLVQGWVGPLFDIKKWEMINSPAEQAIKELGHLIDTSCATEKKRLLRERRKRSRTLMMELHALYRLRNFSGHTATLAEIFPHNLGIPTGTGDCCAPKLFHYAATHNLIPLSLSEFYWGRENKSGSKKHGSFYPPCKEKCEPLLGFLLCGLEELYERRIQ